MAIVYHRRFNRKLLHGVYLISQLSLETVSVVLADSIDLCIELQRRGPLNANSLLSRIDKLEVDFQSHHVVYMDS